MVELRKDLILNRREHLMTLILLAGPSQFPIGWVYPNTWPSG